MPAYKTVAVAGATGNLGPALVVALVNAGFEVTLLSRSGKTNGHPEGVKTAKVDYTSRGSLVAALKGQDVLVSAIPDHGAQPALVDAAIAAGVKRFVPSEFGSDVSGNANTAKLPVFGGKVKTQECLKQKADQISYTIIVNGAFLDWGVMVGFIANLKGGKNRIYDDGDRPRSMSTLADVGKAVAGVLENPEETKNRTVYVQSAAVSQNRLIEFAKKKIPGASFDIEPVDTAELEQRSYEALREEGADVTQAMYGFIAVSIFREGYGGLFGKNDNELLGITGLSDSEIEAVIAPYM